eukprot:scaffold11342_cov114-Isochrysis_galbana.AAC.13
MATVPVTPAYSSHRGSAARCIGMVSAPATTQIAVSTPDCARCPSERRVSRLKQWSGMTARTSDLDGTSSCAGSRALPWSPESSGSAARSDTSTTMG